MESSYCPSCGNPYIAGDVSFCSRCGTSLDKKTSLINDIEKIETEPLPYEGLRFVSGLLVFIGWVIIIVGLLAVSMAYTLIIGVAENMAGETTASIINNISALLTFIICTLDVTTGVMFIASGQVIAVLLDIRNDVHMTRRYTRRFGLHMARKAEPTISVK